MLAQLFLAGCIYSCALYLGPSVEPHSESARGTPHAPKPIAGYLAGQPTPRSLLTNPRKFRWVPVPIARAKLLMMLDEKSRPIEPDKLRLACPVCHRVVLPLPGTSPMRALEGHLELAHWYEVKLAHDTACEAMGDHSR